MMKLTSKDLDLLGPRLKGSAINGHQYNQGNSSLRAERVKGWVKRIKADRNWGRALFSLPLVEPVDPAIREWCERMGSRSNT